MIGKLILRNMRRNFKEYSIYFLTLVLGVCTFYMFNSIYDQKEIMIATQQITQLIESVQKILSLASILVSVVLGFLIVYANNFFIKRRNKELGIYLTLGMSYRNISLIIVMETFLLAVIALAIGLFLGVFGSQFMSIFTAKIFEADLTAYKFIFSTNAFLKSIYYFGLIFIIVILFNIGTIKRCKLINLIYGNKKNERTIFPSLKISVLILTLSIICLITCYTLILKNGLLHLNKWVAIAIFLGCLGTVLFYFSISGTFILLMQKNKRLYFKNLNMFIVRQLSNKINTNFISISIVCITLLFVIGIFSSGYSMQNVLSKDLKHGAKYDFSLYNYGDANENNSIVDNIPKEILNYSGIKDYAEFSLYKSEITFSDLNLNFSQNIKQFEGNNLYFIPLSQYNKIISLTGNDPLILDENQYAISVGIPLLDTIAKQMINKKIPIELNGVTLTPKSIEGETLANMTYGTGIIVNDFLIKDMPATDSILNIQISTEKDEENLDQLLVNYLRNTDEKAFYYYYSKAELYSEAVSSRAMISFLGIYIGFVFMIISAVILSIQQLSEASDNKERYKLLKKLGVDQKILNKTLFTQILIYFICPLILAIVHSIFGLIEVNKLIVVFGEVNISSTIFATSIFIILIYAIYFMITYIGSKNIIIKE